VDTLETLALLAQGREAWNSWASQMLAQKKGLRQTSSQAEHAPPSEAEMAWTDRARADFRGHPFGEKCSFAGFLFPGEADFDPLAQENGGEATRIPTRFEKDVTFDGAEFLMGARLGRTIFEDQASFRETIFSRRVDFRHVSFLGDVWFNLAKFEEALFAFSRFEGEAAFAHATFSAAAGSSFHSVIFSGAARFRGVSFSGGGVSFSQGQFLQVADFGEAKFMGGVRFDEAKFINSANFHRAFFDAGDFEKASFNEDANFDAAQFSGCTSFQRACFKQFANFGRVQSRGNFKLEKAIFLELPNFEGASFSQTPKPDAHFLLAQRSKRRPSKQNTRPYYEVSSDYIHGGAVGWEFVNYRTVQPGGHGVGRRNAWPDGYLQMPRGPWLLADLAETPRFLIGKKLGRSPRDLESTDGFFLVSPAMKSVLEAIDPEACEFLRCETVLPSGEPGRETWLCAITRAFAGAVDEKASLDLRVQQGPNNQPAYAMSSTTRLRFIPEVIGEAHLFHIAEMASYIFCDQAVKEACKAAGLKGILFQKVT